MAQRSDKSPTFTSYHGITITATPSELIEKFGEPQWGQNNGRDKVNMEWVLETTQFPNEWNVSPGAVFTIYDWKYYKPLDMNEEISWHIGAKNSIVSWQAQHEIQNHELLKLEQDGMEKQDIEVLKNLGLFE